MTASTGAQPPELINNHRFRPVAQAAVDSVYNFNFEGAEKVLVPWKQRYPGHPLWLLIEGITFWWQVLSDLEDTSHDEQFFYKMKHIDYQASQLLRKNRSHADGLIIKIISNGYIARQYANRDEWISSINWARKALSSYEYLLELQPGLADLKLAEGLKFYYSAYLPEAYPIVRTVSWFLPEGDKQKGLELLHLAAEEAIFARAEATYFLGNINYNYEKNYNKAAVYFQELYETYPDNNFYARKLVSSLYRMERHGEALKVIDESIERWEQHQLPFKNVLKEELLTWKGRILSRNHQLAEAAESYQQAFALGKKLPNTQERSFHIVSGYYLGHLLYKEGKYARARPYLEEVVKSKNEAAYRTLAKNLLVKIEARQ